MRNLIIINLIFLLQTFVLQAQTLIATSNHPDATANHNQRKIVRDTADNVYVVFQDIINEDTVIKGLYLNRITELWSEAEFICSGKNPTLAISKNCIISLIYETNDSVTSIAYRNTYDFVNWSDEILLSGHEINCKLPVADVDSSGTLNVLWINKVDSYRTLGYSRIIDNEVCSFEFTYFFIYDDISIANHLQYNDNIMYFAIENSSSYYDKYSEVYISNDYMNNFEIRKIINGINPSLTYNYLLDIEWCESVADVLFISESNDLHTVHIDEEQEVTDGTLLQNGPVSCLGIDDVAPPLGYAYLFMKGTTLYQAFSFDIENLGNISASESPIIDSVVTEPYNPSIAYKHFRFDVVDYIWTEQHGDSYQIFYKRNNKYNSISGKTNLSDSDIKVYASPNPFIDNISVYFTSFKTVKSSSVKIFNTSGTLILDKKTDDDSFTWNGKDSSGKTVEPGTYILMIENGTGKTAGKIIKSN